MFGQRAGKFKERLLARQRLIGTWIKTTSYTIAEVLASTEVDVLCLDTEHAPFDREAIDAAVLACRAADMPVLVRTRSAAGIEILNALDVGATGVVIPHIRNAEEARAAAAAAHFGSGGRGYAGSTRAAAFTTKKMSDHLRDSGATTCVITQIEDEEGVENVEQIARVKEVDGLFIGWGDLMVVYGALHPNDERVVGAAVRVALAGASAGKAIGVFLPNIEMVPEWLKNGVNLFLLQSDHAFLLKGAQNLVTAFRGAAEDLSGKS
jgi:2-keto-3-deoxy-L-rhamnonate aldolase RhmA